MTNNSQKLLKNTEFSYIHQGQRIVRQHFSQRTFPEMCESLVQHQEMSIQARELQVACKMEIKGIKTTVI